MSKAQWKQKPIDRNFGQKTLTHVERLEMECAALRATLERVKIDLWNAANREEKFRNAYQDATNECHKLHCMRNAYKWLRAADVVVEDNEEFKHLKGEDMDKFFGIEETPRATTKSSALGADFGQPTGLLVPNALKAQALKLIQMEFDKAYQQHISEHLTWQAPQKR